MLHKCYVLLFCCFILIFESVMHYPFMFPPYFNTATATFRSLKLLVPKTKPSQPFNILPSISSPYLNQKANGIMNCRIKVKQGKRRRNLTSSSQEPNPNRRGGHRHYQVQSLHREACNPFLVKSLLHFQCQHKQYSRSKQ